MAKFRARARTVDLLGRQQIAGIPTAISELFKNAHDAYADRVEADFLRAEDTFVLRDDGVGMTGEQFAERWLVLGTENKVRGQSTRPEPRPGYLPRPVLGEKGIGRLAIASIGPALLILTRPLAQGRREPPIFGSFLHWGMFEIPGINLDEIEIPVEDLGGELPDGDLVGSMVQMFATNLEKLPEDVDDRFVTAIRTDLSNFDVDPAALDKQVEGPSLIRDGHGTHFFVQPTDPSLTAVLERHDDRAPDLQATLIGFADTMRPDTDPPSIRVAFRDHRQGRTSDLLESGEFFTPDEFTHADHHIEGVFDDEGTFTGSVTVYGKDPAPYTLAWPKRGALDCGAFEVHLAAVQPEEASSNLTATALKAMRIKMARLGGLYVYRDGIRILPYGRPEHDWLEIEQERSKRLGAYWSHRRMFGEVTLTGERNRGLEEKAGREGFRDNRAYRQFRELLMHFLRNVATDFFREGGAYAETFTETKTELERKARARAERTKQASKLRKAFAQQLTEILDLIEEGEPQADVERVLSDLREALQDRPSAEKIVLAERRAHSGLASVEERYTMARPRGFALNSELRANWSHYRDALEGIRTGLLNPAAGEVAGLVQVALDSVKAPPAPRQRLIALITDSSHRLGDELALGERDTAGALEQTTIDVHALLLEVQEEFDSTVDRVLAELTATADDEPGIEKRRLAAETLIAETAKRELEALASVAAQLRAVRASRNGAGLRPSELEAIDAIEEELIVLKERNAAELELAQLGLGIQIVGHEFNASVGAVRGALRQLKPWADANAGLRPTFDDLRTGFEHLEGYLRLLEPLQRRLNRRRSRIRGAEIADYISKLFATRLASDNVQLMISDRFASHEVVTFRSTIYPAFVALIDNALFWVGERRGDRWISLDADGEAMLISNSGPPISARDRERIFELGFSRKPGGQGTGLFVVKESLNAQRFEITVMDHDAGWAFNITPLGDDV